MFRSLLWRFRLSPAALRIDDWRRDLCYYACIWRKENPSFFLAAALPFIVLGGLLHFAYADRIRAELERRRLTDITCLARNVYFEARGEPIAGQLAVAEVTLNRLASKRFPDTVCEVVHEKKWDVIRRRYVGAFSWTELDSTARPEKGIPWQRAMAAATAVYDNQEAPRVHGALFYHARNIEPRWAQTKQPVAKIGRHIFYR